MKIHAIQVLAIAFVVTAVTAGVWVSLKARAAKTEEVATNRLAGVEMFAFGGIGIAGSISPGESDYQAILQRPSAKAAFERLFQVGNAQAQCYALVGLSKLDQERFRVLSAQLEKSNNIVETMSGCIMSRKTMGVVVARIKSGAYSGKD